MDCQQEKLIEELKSATYVNDTPFLLPLKIALLCYNDCETITKCIKALLKQGIIPTIEITDTGSTDGTAEMLETQIKNNYYYPAKITLKREKIELPKHEKKAFYRQKVLNETTEKYIMFLNAGVILPKYCIRPMIEELEKDSNLAMVGLRYDLTAYHLQLGAAILKTEIAKQLDWSYDYAMQCGCRNIRDQLIQRGFKIKQINDSVAISD